MAGSSYSIILRSTLIIGGAQLVNISLSLVKIKIVAMFLGPVGVGLAGLYLALIQAFSSVFGLGIADVGGRLITLSETTRNELSMSQLRRSLLIGSISLGFFGSSILFLFSHWIARDFMGDESQAWEVACLSAGVTLTIVSGAQSALLNGLRRINDLAAISMGSSALSAMIGGIALYHSGKNGLITMVLSGPLSTFLIGYFYIKKIETTGHKQLSTTRILQEWWSMATLGIAFMLSSVGSTLAILVARAAIQRHLGNGALGDFQAAWSIGTSYLGFIFAAMVSDYYPRLTISRHDFRFATRLTNEQTEVALLICTPIILVLLSFTPLIVRAFYSESFLGAVDILRWQLFGDILKVMSWPLSYLLLALGMSRIFLLTELMGIIIYITSLFGLIPIVGVSASGIAFVLSYIAYLPAVWWILKKQIGFDWTLAVKVQAVIAVASVALVAFSNTVFAHWGHTSGFVISSAVGLFSLLRILKLAKLRSIFLNAKRFK